MIHKKRLSVVLATYNEKDNIKNCLDSVKGLAEEIIVVDGSSEDDTRNIARNLGARVIKTSNKPMFHTNKQMAIDKAKGDWILQLDADEVVDKELYSEMANLLNQDNKYAAFSISRKNFFLGKWLKKGGLYPDRVIRLFKKGKAYLPQKSVHEQLEVEGNVGELHGHLNHHTAPTFSRYITNANRYTSLTAAELTKSGTETSMQQTIYYIVFKPLSIFFSLFVRHKGMYDGYNGFIFALFSALHWPIAYMKHWENIHVKKINIS